MAERRKENTHLLEALWAFGRALWSFGRAFTLPEDDQPDAPEIPFVQRPLELPAPEASLESAQLLTQHVPGWNAAQPERLPVPTFAPAMTAFGVVFIALGAVTVWPVSVVGACIVVLAIAMWIGELLHD